MNTSRVFLAMLQDAGLPAPVPEYEFHHERRWRVDYCFPDHDHMLALEVEGGIYQYGRHNRASGFLKDMEKYNALAVCGYRLIRVQPKALLTQKTVDLIREALNAR